MKVKSMKKKMTAFVFMVSIAVISIAAAVTGCGRDDNDAGDDSHAHTENAGRNEASGPNDGESQDFSQVDTTELEVHFGDNGAPYTLQLEDNDTARAVAYHVGTSDWRLPIYDYDNFEGWEYMQYYDIPSRYEIPSGAETVTSVKAGDVYYSEPNRIILFYHDAEVTGEYTKVGTIDATDEFVKAVEENPVLEGWSNKIVLISDGE